MEQAVLVRLHNEEEIIYLKGPEFSLGRGLHNSYVCEDLSVSRCHCIFRFENNQWTVLDKSSNGTSLNSRLLSKNYSQPMENNDILTLNELTHYRFCYPYNASKKRRMDNNNSPLEAAANPSSAKEDKILCISDENRAREITLNNTEISKLKTELSREKAIIKKLTDDSKEMQSKIFGLEVDLFNKISSSVKLEQEIIGLKSNCTDLQKERDELQTQLSTYESETNSLRQRLEKSQTLKTQSENTYEEDNSLLCCVLRAEINDKESSIKSKISNTMLLLKTSSDNASAIETIKNNLSELQSELDDMIKKRNELDNNKSIHVVNEDKAEKIQNELFNIMETDLQCSICNEIFVKATSLNCGHTFCKVCIEQWRRQKNTCPVCRVPMKNSLPCIAIDNYVDQTIDLLSPNKKETRQKIKDSHEHEASTSEATNIREVTSNNRSQTVYISSESESESEDWDTEDFSDYSDGYYYGGYGSCYICGDNDHWANSCPQRRGEGGGRPRRR